MLINWHLMSSSLHSVDAQIQGRAIKAGLMEIVIYDHIHGLISCQVKEWSNASPQLTRQKMHLWKDTSLWISM